jgi:catalase
MISEKSQNFKLKAYFSAFDPFSQATLFFKSQSEAEQRHIAKALSFELRKVDQEATRIRMMGLLSQVDKGLAENVANVG